MQSTSIKSFLNSGASVKHEDNNVREPSVEMAKDSGAIRSDAFTVDALRRVWAEYAEPLEQTNPRLFSMLTAQSPRINEEGIIVFPFKNETQESELLKTRQKLMEHLRNTLNNDTLRLQTEYISEESGETIVFTSHDRYKAMNEKNPMLARLKEKLKLDLE